MAAFMRAEATPFPLHSLPVQTAAMPATFTKPPPRFTSLLIDMTWPTILPPSSATHALSKSNPGSSPERHRRRSMK